MKRAVFLLLGAAIAAGCGRVAASERLSDPKSTIWTESVPGIEVPLLRQQMALPHGGTNRYATIRSAYADGRIFVRISWEDTSPNTSSLERSFADGVAVMFAPNTNPMPSPFMGDADNPVIIWHWRADWQNPETQSAAFEDSYPSYTDGYPDHEKPAFESLGRRPSNGSAVMEYMARGFGTLTAQPSGEVEARGYYDHEARTWHVLFRRALQLQDDTMLVFDDRKDIPVTVAIWDGGKGERGSRKSVTLMWQRIRPARFR